MLQAEMESGLMEALGIEALLITMSRMKLAVE